MGILNFFNPISYLSIRSILPFLALFMIGFSLGSIPASYPPEMIGNIYWEALFTVTETHYSLVESYIFPDLYYWAQIPLLFGFDFGFDLFEISQPLFFALFFFVYVLIVWIALGTSSIQIILGIIYLGFEKLFNFSKTLIGGAKNVNT